MTHDQAEALRKLLTTAKLLQQNSVICAVRHHGADVAADMPPWLADCQRDIETAEDALASPAPAGGEVRYRHKKRGSTYRVIGNAMIQTGMPLTDEAVVTVYQSETDGTLWVRPWREFEDGRFEKLPEAAPQPVQPLHELPPSPDVAGVVEALNAWAGMVSSGYQVPAAGQVMLNAATLLSSLSRERDALSAEVEKLREALRPFVRHHEAWMDTLPDHAQLTTFPLHTAGDLRRARALSKGTEG